MQQKKNLIKGSNLFYFSDFFNSILRFASIKARAKLTIANGAVEVSPKPVSLNLPCLVLVTTPSSLALATLPLDFVDETLSEDDLSEVLLLPSTFTLPFTPIQ